MTGDSDEEERVQAAVRRHVRNSAFAEAEKFSLEEPWPDGTTTAPAPGMLPRGGRRVRPWAYRS
ncbi:hypothetical protein AB0N07_51560, partial [Streptomyces sp. NPDC051172]|uniref:hypothetical protein n=1 Tax=Streptomyces sp. NPDC051172 TaxID=3155796 RepID=UPI0034357CFC